MTGQPTEPDSPSPAPDSDRPAVVVPLDPERIGHWRRVVAEREPLDRVELDALAAILDRVRARKRATTDTDTGSDPHQYPNAA
ncbi:hypothetical protein HGA13_12610 [Nocardia speluncae]|uniref:Uncharacterized protein n=1 Tax=Nocardia speluncae TaxID=419477 RepID=A0A846XC50_9NOCA|nr:hypothetical protein [Nocardia speluncae]NKY33911.1 hypothetical protein [Nocardia speluncae]